MYNYDNIIDEKMRDLKCFKCESMEELTSYRLAKVTNIKSNSSFMSKSQSYTYYTTGFNVPVCKECLKGIREWEQYKVKNKTSRICGGFLYFAVIILVSFIFMQGNSMGVQHLWFLVIFFGIVASIFLGYSLKVKLSADAMDSNPWKYFKIEGKGIPYVKSKDSARWIPYQRWIESKLQDRKYEKKIKHFIVCPKCDELNKKETNYCTTCGTLMRE